MSTESLADDYAGVLAEKAQALKVGNPAADDLAGNPGSLTGYGSGQPSHSMQGVPFLLARDLGPVPDQETGVAGEFVIGPGE